MAEIEGKDMDISPDASSGSSSFIPTISCNSQSDSDTYGNAVDIVSKKRKKNFIKKSVKTNECKVATSSNRNQSLVASSGTKSKFNEFFDISGTTGVCKLCSKTRKKAVEIQMKNRNTSGLKKHLLSVHKNEYLKLFPSQQQLKPISSFFSSTNEEKNSNSEQVIETNDDLITRTVDCVTKKYLPFSFFEDQETQEYFKSISPNLRFPKRATLRRHVELRFNELQRHLKTQLRNCSSKASFTIDGWTSIAGRTFYGITVHFIDNDWNYQSIVLDFVPSHGQHTGRDIAKMFYTCLQEYGLENKIQGITVDNASANTTFMTELAVLLPDFDSTNQHFRCMAHILNLGVQDLLKSLKLQSPEADRDMCDDSEDISDKEDEDCAITTDDSTAVSKLRSIIVKIKRSEILKRKFFSACDTAGVPNTLTPVLDCPTRWGSTYDMLSVALKLKAGFVTLCSIVPELGKYKITEDEWTMFEKIQKFLQNFKILTSKLGAEKYVTLPLVIVSFNLLVDKVECTIKFLDEKENRTEIDERLILGFQACRDKMLKHYIKTNWIYCTTLILDPKHKSETFELTTWGKQLKEESLRRFESIYNEYKDSYSPSDVYSKLNENRDENEDKDIIDFNQLYCTSLSASASQGNRTELDEYISQPRAVSSEDVLMWWKQHEDHFPTLAKMARDFLSISATSVPAERLFSKASLVIRKHRNRLNNESARWLLCLNSWSTKLK